MDITYGICAVYLVDVMQSRSSEVLAAIKYFFCFICCLEFQALNELFFSSVMLSVLCATIVAVILPMIDAYGAAVTYLLCAILIWTSYGYVIVPENKNKRLADAWHLIADYTTSLNMVSRWGRGLISDFWLLKIIVSFQTTVHKPWFSLNMWSLKHVRTEYILMEKFWR